jgi:hypothetical protein
MIEAVLVLILIAAVVWGLRVVHYGLTQYPIDERLDQILK